MHQLVLDERTPFVKQNSTHIPPVPSVASTALLFRRFFALLLHSVSLDHRDTWLFIRSLCAACSSQPSTLRSVLLTTDIMGLDDQLQSLLVSDGAGLTGFSTAPAGGSGE